MIDTTSRPTGEGNPIGYFPQEQLDDFNDEDVNRLVRNYDPETEFVVVLLKSHDRTSSYRIRPMQRED